MVFPTIALGCWVPVLWAPAPHIFISPVYLWPLLSLFHLPSAWQPLQGLEKCLSWEQAMTLLAWVPSPLTLTQSCSQRLKTATFPQCNCPSHVPGNN